MRRPGLRSRSRRFLGAVGFLATLGVGVGFLSDSGCPIGSFFYITLLNWEFLLKWYNFFWNFCWIRAFLLCTTISIDFKTNFIRCVKESESAILESRNRIFYLRLRSPGGNKLKVVTFHAFIFSCIEIAFASIETCVVCYSIVQHQPNNCFFFPWNISVVLCW